MQTQRDGSFSPGTVVAGRFELRQHIGAGGMGAVWSARDRKSGGEVAVKQLRSSDSDMLLRFVREQGLRISHPHVVAPTGWAADDDTVVLSMDLVRGGSLETLVRDQGALPASFVAVLMQQLVQALAEIHAHGVIHRDIKPANLLLEPTGAGRPHLRVADFGVAVVQNEPRLTQTAMSVGTPGYLAQDLAMGADPAPMHDLYAAGVVGKRLLTGVPVSELPVHHSSALWPLLSWMCEPDPHRRPRNAHQVLGAMETHHLVPSGTPWAGEPDAPYVFDQMGPMEPRAPRRGTAVGATVAQQHADKDVRPRSRTGLWVGAIGAFAGAAVLLVVAVMILVQS